jgi:hypothetical protein
MRPGARNTTYAMGSIFWPWTRERRSPLGELHVRPFMRASGQKIGMERHGDDKAAGSSAASGIVAGFRAPRVRVLRLLSFEAVAS